MPGVERVPEVRLDGLVDAVEAAGVAVAVHTNPVVGRGEFGGFLRKVGLHCG